MHSPPRRQISRQAVRPLGHRIGLIRCLIHFSSAQAITVPEPPGLGGLFKRKMASTPSYFSVSPGLLISEGSQGTVSLTGVVEHGTQTTTARTSTSCPRN